MQMLTQLGWKPLTTCRGNEPLERGATRTAIAGIYTV